ncbi:MAG TPA: hypothetical protein VIC26_06690 [Marinagarivorans sp.]
MAWLFWFAGLWVSWRYIDLSSTGLIASAVAPFCFVVCLIVLVVKVARRLSGDSGYGGDSGDDGSLWDWLDGWWDSSPTGDRRDGGSDSGGDGGGD